MTLFLLKSAERHQHLTSIATRSTGHLATPHESRNMSSWFLMQRIEVPENHFIIGESVNDRNGLEDRHGNPTRPSGSSKCALRFLTHNAFPDGPLVLRPKYWSRMVVPSVAYRGSVRSRHTTICQTRSHNIPQMRKICVICRQNQKHKQ